MRFALRDERKTLTVCYVAKKSSLIICNVPLRQPGRQGLNPEIVDMTTASIRSNYKNALPNKPEDFHAIVVFATLTADGHLAMRPDDPSSLNLSIRYDINNITDMI